MMNFCTLFDSFYLPRGLTMYRSLENVCDDFHLYIFAFDDNCFKILNKLKLEKATIISLKEFENEQLLTVKPGRTKAEYCWTTTPSTIFHVIEKYNVSNCTYLDADLYFYQNPKLLLDEMGNKSVLITEHRYPPKFNRTGKAGIYCVQFITFINDDNGIKALKWWRDACLEWCYDRYEDGKFGDQKYLDDWTTRFKGVHVLQHLGGGLAYWNVGQYILTERKGNQIVFLDKSTSKKFEAVFYHFHFVRFYKNDIVDFGWLQPAIDVVKNIYAPYIIALNESETLVKQADNTFYIPLQKITSMNKSGLRNKLKYLFKVVFRYNVFNVKKLIANYKQIDFIAQ